MAILYIENYFIFSVFLTLFMLEIGIALMSLIKNENYLEKFRKYLITIWGIDGTFAVFYLVSLEATYPTLLTTIGYTYAVPILLGGLFFVARNGFLVYSELTNRESKGRQYIRVYAISIIIIAYILIMTLASAISGIGTNLSSNSINVLQFLTDPFGLMVLIATALLSLYFTATYFQTIELRRSSPYLALIALTLVLTALFFYTPQIWSNIASQPYLIAAAIILIVAASYLSMSGFKYSKYFVFAVIVLLINMFGVVQYPYIFGGSAMITSYLTSSALATDLVATSIIGGVILLFSLVYFFRLAHR